MERGRRIGRYEILELIASGGMGEVYRARDLKLGRDVAIKVLNETLAADPAALARFEREAKAIAALSHPNILAIHDYAQEETLAYSVTELLEGETLRERITRGPMPWQNAAAIGADIAEALSAAHSRGIVHRDLKPENVVITRDGRVKVLDFGIALLVPIPDEDISDTPTAPLDTDGEALIGTASYMSPEQLKGESASPASDIFSLGLLLFELIAGRNPFQRRNSVETLSAILTSPTPPFEAPPAIERLVNRCLEKDPAQRFQSARDLAFALRAASRHSGEHLAPRSRLNLRTVAIFVLAIAVPLISAFLVIDGRNRQRESVASIGGAVDSIAVLPFENASHDPAIDYLSDGITESLINSLSRMSRLRVMSRSTVFHYKGTQVDSRQIGKELDVRAVLIGRVTRLPGELAISAELVDTSDGRQLWSYRTRGVPSDLFAMQQRIAGEIAFSIRPALTAEEVRQVRKRSTTSAEAYDLYLKGRYQWNKRSADGLYKAIEFFNAAIEADPNYAHAYAGLADCYSLLDIWAALPTRETFPKAKAAAVRALQLDESLAEAHTSLAYALHTYEWNWDAAEREYRRAIELNPNYATAHQWYGEFLTARGRFEEAAKEGQRALELDPLSPIINAVVGWNLGMARRHDAAIEQTRRTTELFPTFMPGHAYLGLSLLHAGRMADALPVLERALEIQDIPVVRTWYIRALRGSGREDEARRALIELEKTSPRYLPSYYLSTVYAELGRTDDALRSLRVAFEERNGSLVWIAVDPAVDPLREDTRFKKIAADVVSGRARQ